MIFDWSYRSLFLTLTWERLQRTMTSCHNRSEYAGEGEDDD